jgi:hypothetical protein
MKISSLYRPFSCLLHSICKQFISAPVSILVKMSSMFACNCMAQGRNIAGEKQCGTYRAVCVVIQRNTQTTEEKKRLRFMHLWQAQSQIRKGQKFPPIPMHTGQASVWIEKQLCLLYTYIPLTVSSFQDNESLEKISYSAVPLIGQDELPSRHPWTRAPGTLEGWGTGILSGWVCIPGPRLTSSLPEPKICGLMWLIGKKDTFTTRTIWVAVASVPGTEGPSITMIWPWQIWTEVLTMVACIPCTCSVIFTNNLGSHKLRERTEPATPGQWSWARAEAVRDGGRGQGSWCSVLRSDYHHWYPDSCGPRRPWEIQRWGEVLAKVKPSVLRNLGVVELANWKPSDGELDSDPGEPHRTLKLVHGRVAPPFLRRHHASVKVTFLRTQDPQARPTSYTLADQIISFFLFSIFSLFLVMGRGPRAHVC